MYNLKHRRLRNDSCNDYLNVYFKARFADKIRQQGNEVSNSVLTKKQKNYD